MNCHLIAKRVSVRLVVFAAGSIVADKLLQWVLAKGISATTKHARQKKEKNAVGDRRNHGVTKPISSQNMVLKFTTMNSNVPK